MRRTHCSGQFFSGTGPLPQFFCFCWCLCFFVVKYAGLRSFVHGRIHAVSVGKVRVRGRNVVVRERPRRAGVRKHVHPAARRGAGPTRRELRRGLSDVMPRAAFADKRSLPLRPVGPGAGWIAENTTTMLAKVTLGDPDPSIGHCHCPSIARAELTPLSGRIVIGLNRSNRVFPDTQCH